MQQTKHQQVIAHIESLPVGEKVSVRQLARELGVSEGTVYRAIKEAENQGYVTSIPKVGTLRIEKNKERTIDTLTYYELSLLLEGSILSGDAHREEVPKTYLVALSADDLDNEHLHPQTMIITDAKQEAIVQAALALKFPLLLANVSHTGEPILAVSDVDQVVISCPYDIFELISLINQTIFERVKRREYVMVSDIMTENPSYLTVDDHIEDYFQLSKQTHHSHFPVVNHDGKLAGIVTARLLANREPYSRIGDAMETNPLLAKPDDLMSYLARLFVLEGTEIVPVVSFDDTLAGVVTRQDIIIALQSTQKQPQFGDTTDIVLLSGFQLSSRSPFVEVSGPVTDFMLDEYGEMSIGSLSSVCAQTATIGCRVMYNAVCQPEVQSVQLYEPIVEGMVIKNMVELYPKRQGEYLGSVRVVSENNVVLAQSMISLTSRDK